MQRGIIAVIVVIISYYCEVIVKNNAFVIVLGHGIADESAVWMEVR